MPLQSGARIGPYEVLSPLGAGGMGEVYRARDHRLGRDVAIKVLPGALADVPQRVARFEREARSASALNHPNIVTIYEIGSGGSVPYIAMELVPGESLRSSLLDGPMPVRRLLDIAIQLAEGLAKAHASGIVHRDLKPENVMVTKEGHVKILDFGLAKLTHPDSSSGSSPAPADETATQEGIILGTVGYMSPEQATGAPVDYRSDQFSLGSILYEMATSSRAFERASKPQTLAAIIQDEPEPIASRNPRVPPPLRWTVQRCLAKDAADRYASTEDLARELVTIRDNLSDISAVGGLPAEPVRTPRRRRWIAAAIAAATLLTLGFVAWRLRESDYFWKNPLVGARFTRLTDWEGSEVEAAISRDGKFVAFLSDRVGIFDAWVTQVGSDEFLNLSRGEFPGLYFDRIRTIGFSGDDAHVWMYGDNANGQGAWFVSTIGGTPRLGVPEILSAAWSRDGTRLAHHGGVGGDPIFVADRNGANPRQIFVDKAGRHNHYLAWSPDGHFIYFVRGIMDPWDMDIWRIPSQGGTAEQMTNHHSRVADPTLLDERTLLYTAARPDASGSGLYVMDIERRIPHAVSFGLEEYTSIAASADGRRLVATVANPTSHIWSAPISDRVADESAVTRVLLPAVRARTPRFGPDYFLFLSYKHGGERLWKFQNDSASELWRDGGPVVGAPSVSRDGSRICFIVREEGQNRLYVMSADGTGARRVSDTLDARDAASWSPDGKWISVAAAEGEEQPLFKVPVDGGPAVRLTGGVNLNPVWSPDGRFIVYSVQLCRTGVPAQGDHPGEGAIPDPGNSGPLRGKPISVPAGRQIIGCDARGTPTPGLLAARLRDREATAAHQPPSGPRHAELRRLS